MGDFLLAALGFGLVTAALLSVAAVGFTLQFSVTNVFNLAYTDLMTVAAFCAYALNSLGMNLWAALPVAGLAGAVASLLLNRLVLQPLLRRGTNLFGMLIVTLAIGLIIWNIVLAIVRPGFFHYRVSQGQTYRFAGQILTLSQLVIIAVAAGTLICVHLLLKHSKLGKAMRAVAANPDLARACGIPSRRVIDITWLLSGFLCGIAGVVLCVGTAAFNTTTARGLLTLILATVMLGGVGQPYGAMAAALILGLSSEMIAVLLSPEWKDVLSLLVLVVVLLVRPQGILAEVATEKEAAAA